MIAVVAKIAIDLFLDSKIALHVLTFSISSGIFDKTPEDLAGH